jgi:hypothetical protein
MPNSGAKRLTVNQEGPSMSEYERKEAFRDTKASAQVNNETNWCAE